MSECVVRMKMPKCCDDCDANYDCCACGISGEFWFRNPKYKEFDSSKERLPNCPIVCQFPEGHGRLVDADAFEKDVSDALVYGLKEIPSGEGKQIFHVLMQEVLDNVKKRETIVPAEAKRSGT